MGNLKIKADKVKLIDGSGSEEGPAAKKQKTDKEEEKEINSIKIVYLKFMSDHAVLKDHDANWSDGGARFPKPEWTPSQAHPVSHSMGSEVKVELQLEIGPDGAKPKKGNLIGKGPCDLTFKKENHAFQPGKTTLILTSEGRLPLKVKELGFNIKWRVEGVGVAISPSKTQNKMFVTVGPPRAPTRSPGITLKRMRQAVKVASKAPRHDDPHSIVKHVMSKWGNFNLEIVYDNEWELSDDTGDGADCQTIVRYTESIILMLGCPGKADFIVVWAKVPSPTRGEENPAYEPHVASPRQYYNSYRPYVADRTEWDAALVDHSDGVNNYEACLRFEHGGTRKYYAGGVGEKADANEVIKVFKSMSWVAPDTTGTQYEIMEVIHEY